MALQLLINYNSRLWVIDWVIAHTMIFCSLNVDGTLLMIEFWGQKPQFLSVIILTKPPLLTATKTLAWTHVDVHVMLQIMTSFLFYFFYFWFLWRAGSILEFISFLKDNVGECLTESFSLFTLVRWISTHSMWIISTLQKKKERKKLFLDSISSDCFPFRFFLWFVLIPSSS